MNPPNIRDYDTQEEYDEAYDNWVAYQEHKMDEDRYDV